MNPTVQQLPVRKLLALCGFIVLVVVAYWLSGFCFITVQTSGQQSGEIRYSLLDQKNRGTTEAKTSETTYKKLVRKGSYEVIAQQGNSSYFAVVTTGGFFGTSRVEAALQPEKARQFVGSNPEFCMHMLKQQVLISYLCSGGSTSDALVHVPATATSPTYNQAPQSIVNGQIEGLAHTKDGDVAVVKNTGALDISTPPQAAYLLDANAELKNAITLSGLSESVTYTLAPYGEGFLAIDPSYSQALYYASVSSKPEVITPARPDDSTLVGYSLSTQGNKLAIAYSKASTDSSLKLDDPASAAKTKSTVVVQTGNQTQKFNLPKRFASINLCGSSMLCGVLDKTLEIYDISGNKPQFLYKVEGVSSTVEVDDHILVNRDKDILDLDLVKRGGSIAYSYGEYQACGVQASAPGALLCVINSKQQKSALYLDPKQTGDAIDQQVGQLIKKTPVKNVSAYGQFIYVSPDLGPATYQGTGIGYGYSPSSVQTATAQILEAAKQSGIDTTKYQVINTLQ